MSKRIVNLVYELVDAAAKNPKNIFQYSAFPNHILVVRKFAKLLANKLGADEEICELAALFHDYASLLGKEYVEKHQEHGAKLAKDFLITHGYPEEKAKAVAYCVSVHRGSTRLEKKTLESKILASADAMAHIDNITSVIHLAYGIHQYDTEEGAKWVLKKLARSWDKLMPEAKKLIQKKYNAIQLSLS